MKSEKIKISKITINIGNTKLELTLEQAKELHEILNETFPKKEIQYIPSSPIIIERERPYWPPYKNWEITWRSSEFDTNNLSLSLK